MKEVKQLGLVVLTGAVLSLQATVYGESFAYVGARANGMGGANAASVRDSTAQWHNPAAFGFMGRAEWQGNAVDNGGLSSQGFSWELFGIGAGYTMTEDMGRYIDILADIDFNAFDQGELSAGSENVKALLSMVGIVSELDANDTLYADASAGTSMQIGSFGIGVRLFGEAVAWTSPDLDNLALDDYADVGSLVNEINLASSTDNFVWNGTYNLSDQQRTDLASSLGGINPDSVTIQYLDAKLGELRDAGDLTGSEIAGAVDLFSNLAPGASGNISSNLTGVVGRGFALVEVPVSYGWAVNENLSIGATVKAMFGKVLGTKIWIFNENNDEVFQKMSDNAQSTVNVGIDLGALYRISNFQFALTGHNLNRPTFDGFTDTLSYSIDGGATQTETITVPDVEVDPQVTIGAAFMPSQRLTLEVNYDLLETGTLLQGYDIQRLSFGGELDVWLLALRLGAYRNIAESWQEWVATAGIGINLVGVRLDVGGAYSLGDDAEYNNSNIPAEARLYASIGLDF